jgi:uncharacterized protein
VEGTGLPRDLQRGIGLLDSLCKASNAQACNEKGCAGGDYAACAAAGSQYASGVGAQVNIARARLLLQRACDHGQTPGCQGLTNLPKPRSPGPAATEVAADHAVLDFTVQQAEACDSAQGACAVLAQMFAYEIDVPLDSARAVYYYDRACSGSDASACTILGRYYNQPAKPSTTAIDANLAKTYFTQAFDLNQSGCNSAGLPIACYSLGEAYASGEGVTQNTGQAVQILNYGCQFFQFGFMCRAARELTTGKAEAAGPELSKLPAGATALSRFYASDCDAGGVPACGRFLRPGTRLRG